MKRHQFKSPNKRKIMTAIMEKGEMPANALNKSLGDSKHDFKERLAGTLEKAKATYKRFGEKANQGVKATDKAVRTHPYPAIGIAFGVGLLVGVLVSRK
jgi:ElaB/YqjD/DUF883 family membrane-anchored ribosome-binding protein